MSGMTTGRIVLGVVALLIVGVAVLFSMDMRKAYGSLKTYNTTSIQTSFGNMTYVDQGKGVPVLLVHGISGGYDQALQSFQELFPGEYRLIAPARFGYLGSDLPAEATPTHQADAFKQLLDQLGIKKAIVMATSAGSGSALQFATLFPERTQALILLSSAAPALPGIKYMSGPPDVVYTDFVMWLMTRTAKPFFLTLFGVDKAVFKSASEEEKASFARTFDTILPVSPRRKGILNDKYITNPDMERNPQSYKLEAIKAPTLILHAKDDPMALFPPVEAMAGRISKSRLVTFEHGGHVIFNQSTGLKNAVAEFLTQL